MKLSCVLFSCVVLALVCVSVSASIDTEWVQPSFIERAALPTPGQRCGSAGGVCSAKALWCGKKRPVAGQCHGSAVCCTPVTAAAPAPKAPVTAPKAPVTAPTPSPRPTGPVPPIGAIRPTNVVAQDATRVVVPGPAPIVGSSSVTNLPVGDLSASEETVEGTSAEETPLQSAVSVALNQADAAVRAIRNPNTPPLTYQLQGLFNDAVTYAGKVYNGRSGPAVAGGAGAGKTGVIPAVGTVPTGVCGAYASSTVTKIAGNGGTIYEVVKVLPQHAEDRSMLTASPAARDNTMRTSTACAFDRMHEAAKKAGVNILIASAFRTHARQQYFWNCFQTKKCNKGRKAARPGRSNHGRGIALDLNQAASGVYNWLRNNAHTYGFIRTVPEERWHWEYRPNERKAPYT